MRIRLLILSSCLLWAVTTAQLPESLAPAGAFEEYRTEGETRVWSFEREGQSVGILSSTISDKQRIGGVPGYVITQEFALDLTRTGVELSLRLEGEQYVSEQGHYLGCDLKSTFNGAVSRSEIKRDGDRLVARVTSDQGSSESALPSDRGIFGFEAFLVDLTELYLTMHGLTVGESYADSLYAIQAMLPIGWSALCLDFKLQGLYTGKYDSVFIVNATAPEPMRLYFTKSRRLLKAEILNRNLKVYQDYVGPDPRKSAHRAFTLAGLANALPAAPAYLIFAWLSVLLLVGTGFKKKVSYIALGGGVILAVLIPLVLAPFQTWLLGKVVVPGVQQEQSLWALGLLPALAGGIFITGLLVVGIVLLGKVRSDNSPGLAALGAFFGAGLAIAESLLVATDSTLTRLYGLQLAERAATALTYVTLGALMGRTLDKSADRVVQAAAVSIGVLALFRYLPVFVQQQVFDNSVQYVVSLVLAVVVAAVGLIVLRRFGRATRKSGPRSARPSARRSR